MGLLEFEIISDGVSIIDNDEASSVSLTMAQWQTLVKYFDTHPLDKHGWKNHIREDGSLTGMHACPCHNIDNRSLNE